MTTNAILGRHILGRDILAGTSRTGAVYIADYPLIEDAYEISFYDHDGIRVRSLSARAADCPVISLEFALTETGCDDFTLGLHKGAGAELFYNQRVDIALFGDRQPWYSGYLTTLPLPGGTADKDTFKGMGFYNQLDTVLFDREYAGLDIASIVRDLMLAEVDLKTDIQYHPGKITYVGYVAQGLKFEQRTAKDSFKTLAEFATDTVYGVDEYRDFYFRPRNHEINEQSRFFVGQHVHKFEPEEDTGDIVNFFYVKYGAQDAKGSNIYQEPFFDEACIAKYGLREAVLSVPEAVAEADVRRWAAAELDKVKDPKRTAKLDKFSPDVAMRKVFPDGMARVVSADGLFIYDYPIKEVKYKINDKGLTFAMSMGENAPRVDDFIAQMTRNMKNAEYLQQLNNNEA